MIIVFYHIVEHCCDCGEKKSKYKILNYLHKPRIWWTSFYSFSFQFVIESLSILLMSIKKTKVSVWNGRALNGGSQRWCVETYPVWTGWCPMTWPGRPTERPAAGGGGRTRRPRWPRPGGGCRHRSGWGAAWAASPPPEESSVLQPGPSSGRKRG